MGLLPNRRHPHQPNPSGRKQRTTTRRNQLGPTRPRRRIHHRHQKQRRVGTWDAHATKLAMKRSGIARNVLTMADKVIPEIHGMQGPITNEQLQNSPELMDLITKTEQATGTPVWIITTSENTALILEKP